MSTAALMIDESVSHRVQFMLRAGRIALTLGFVGMLIATLVPEVRTEIRTTVSKDFRMVSSTAQGDLLGTGSALTVAKIKTRDALLLEVYEMMADGSQRLLERIDLPDRKDGYFNFNGRATNLAIDDIDGDGKMEIIAPTFDQNLVGRLNVYRYDQGAGTFNRVLR